jgi:hypothetical protein
VNDSNVNVVTLSAATLAYNFTANGEVGLIIDDMNAGYQSDSIVAGGANQIITGGSVGNLTVTESLSGGDVLRDSSAVMNGDAVFGFGAGSNTLDVTDLSLAKMTANFTENALGTFGELSLTDGAHVTTVTLFGQFMAAGFSGTAAAAGFAFGNDGLGGTDVTYHPILAAPH